jgi:serine O-acetyltransferase
MANGSRLVRWLRAVPRALARAREDVHAIEANDPAARSSIETLLLWMHRVAHRMWGEGAKLPARLLAYANRHITGIEIHPGASIGRRVVIDHGMGIVIGETAIVGDGCLLYKGVVLGGTSFARTKRHPTLGPGVVVGSNACILGAIEVGARARIGSGSVVVKAVPPEATVVGVPGRVISPRGHRFDAALDHANLPDPVTDLIRALAQQNERLRLRVSALEAKLGLSHDPRDDHPQLPYEGDEMPPADGG